MRKKIVVSATYKQFLPYIVLGVLLIFFAITTIYFYSQYKKATGKKIAQEELKEITDKLSKMILLPQEGPTLATIADKSKLASQDFYKNAQNGDKILIYRAAKKAILYRPSTNMIIEVSTISIEDEQALTTENQSPPQTTQAATASADMQKSLSPTPTKKPATVAVYNGSKTAGLAAKTETKLTQSIQDITVISKTNSTLDYEKTLLVDITGNNKTLLEAMQKLIGGSIGSLPEGEKKPSADILIIVAEEKQ